MRENQKRLQKLYLSIVKLNRQRLDLEANEEYELAAQIKEELFIWGEELKRMTIELMQEEQMNEREELEQQYEFELLSLEDQWMKELSSNEQRIKEQLDMLEKKHIDDMSKAHNEINSKISRSFKSKETLNLEYQIQKLAQK